MTENTWASVRTVGEMIDWLSTLDRSTPFIRQTPGHYCNTRKAVAHVYFSTQVQLTDVGRVEGEQYAGVIPSGEPIPAVHMFFDTDFREEHVRP